MWDVRAYGFDSINESSIGMLEIANHSLDDTTFFYNFSSSDNNEGTNNATE